MIQCRVPADTGGSLRDLRNLASCGELAATASGSSAITNADLRREAFVVVWPLVYQHHTCPLERRRGHLRCARSVRNLEPVCHDGFLDDVIAVVDYVLAYAKTPITNLEGWISTRIAGAVVDGHRRRRGQLGAQQRPRVPHWLVAALDEDVWLIELARRILEWVGVVASAGTDTWPFDTWAENRAAITGEWHRIADGPTVLKDVETVCTTMRLTRPDWYQRYVEAPLAAKEGLTLRLCSDATLTSVAAQHDADRRLIELAGLALDVIVQQTHAGGDPALVVPAAIRRIFLGRRGSYADDFSQCGTLPTSADSDDDVLASALADPRRTARITDAVIQILSAQSVPAVG